jgi:hypothetical protein
MGTTIVSALGIVVLIGGFLGIISELRKLRRGEPVPGVTEDDEDDTDDDGRPDIGYKLNALVDVATRIGNQAHTDYIGWNAQDVDLEQTATMVDSLLYGLAELADAVCGFAIAAGGDIPDAALGVSAEAPADTEQG